MNFLDPLGLAKCGDSLTGDACESALDDADTARTNTMGAAGALRAIAQKKRDGEELTQAESDAVALVQSRFGKEYGSADNLDKVAKGLDKIADKIGERGRGATLERGNEGVRIAAYVLYPRSSDTIYLNNSFFGSSATNRAQTLTHEAGHLAGFLGDLYAGRGHRFDESLDYAVRANDRASGRKPFDLSGNADSYACSVAAYESACE